VRLPTCSPRAYRRITGIAVVALTFIIVTGAAVRLTGSGLGCPTWPNCEPGSLTPVAASSANASIEFANRLVTGAVSVAVALAVLGSLGRTPRRADLTRLSLGLVAGVIAQILLGGVTVLTHLSPPIVMAHFLLSLVLLGNAVVLHYRAGEPAGRSRSAVTPALERLGWAALALAVVVVVTGTVVTGSGPHGGDAEVERLPWLVPDVARVHGTAVIAFLLVLLVAAWHVRRGGPAAVVRALTALLVVVVAQAAVGYTQYFTGVPVLLVGVHVLGAALVWIATVRFVLALRPVVADPVSPASATPALAGA
jgi:cytochrome c oxidase assembly protein subunit 15